MRYILFFIIALIVALYLCSCCFIGLTVGTIADNNKSDIIVTRVPSKISTVKSGSKVEIFLKDKSQVRGKFLGFESISDDEYAQKYEKCCQKLIPKIKVPAIGEKVIIYSAGMGRQEGEFIGFDYDKIFFKPRRKNITKSASLSDITQIRVNNQYTLNPERITNLILESKIPLKSLIVVINEDGKSVVPFENVNQMIIPDKKREKLVGFLIGAGVDLIVYGVVERIGRNLPS